MFTCLEYGSKNQKPGFYLPSKLIMYIKSGLSIAAWEHVYAHETAHSLINDCWLGWTIQALDDLSLNLFIALKNGMKEQSKLTSWILNVEYKKRKLCETWLQTQEGAALFFQLDYIDIESRMIGIARK